MREIKFRAISECRGEHWVYGDLRHYNRNPRTEKWTIHDPATGIETDIAPDTIGQYTGLKDINGTEVYEGDIVKCEGEAGIDSRIVAYYEEAFNVATLPEYDCVKIGTHPYMNDYAHMTALREWSNTGLVKVLSNIHDNPEMMKGGKK